MQIAPSKIRLFCFPAGGSGASMYRSWSKMLGDHISVVPVQFPGREERYADEQRTSVPSLVEYVREVFTTVDGSFAFFGHSLGALVSFEVARDLRRRGGRIPSTLFVSGYPAPHLPRNRPRISHLDKEQFLDALIDSFDVTAAVAQDRKLLEYAYPVLHADITAVEAYAYKPEPPLDSRIIALGGSGDREASQSELLEWQRETNEPLQFRLFSGGHFYLLSEKDKVINCIEQELGNL